VQRERLVREAAQKLELNPSALFEELRKIMRRAGANARSDEKQPEPASMTMPTDERELCGHLVQSEDTPESVGLAKKYLPLEFVKHPLCRDVISVVMESAGKGEDITEVVREKDGSEGEMQAFVSGLIMGPSKAGIGERSPVDAVKDIILHIWRRELKEERKRLDAKADQTVEEKERRRQITYDLKALQNWESAEPILEIEMETRHG